MCERFDFVAAERTHVTSCGVPACGGGRLYMTCRLRRQLTV